jgi:fucose permease
MLRVRNADAFAAGASSSGFWAGMVAGRALLGFVTDKFGERLSVLAYITLSIGLQLLFWLVPQFIVSAVAVSFLGFFLGPLYPAAITLAAKLLPKHLHVVCMGFALAIGGAGGAISPFTVGTIAGSTGVWVLQPIMVGLLLVMIGMWFAFPKVQKND